MLSQDTEYRQGKRQVCSLFDVSGANLISQLLLRHTVLLELHFFTNTWQACSNNKDNNTKPVIQSNTWCK